MIGYRRLLGMSDVLPFNCVNALSIVLEIDPAWIDCHTPFLQGIDPQRVGCPLEIDFPGVDCPPLYPQGLLSNSLLS